MSGVDGVDPAELRALTLTAPGLDVIRSGDALVEFNRTAMARWHRVASELARIAPGLEFVRVVELQKRGAVHLHVVIRGASAVTLRRVRRLAVGAGFGPRVEWAPVRDSRGLGRYLAGYLMKSRDVFPPGTRVLEASRGWSLAPSPAPPPVEPPVPGARAEPAWYGGPPPGVGWWEFAEDPAGILAGRAYRRLRRAREALGGFEALTRARFARWLGSPRGMASVARTARKGLALPSPGPDRREAA